MEETSSTPRRWDDDESSTHERRQSTLSVFLLADVSAVARFVTCRIIPSRKLLANPLTAHILQTDYRHISPHLRYVDNVWQSGILCILNPMAPDIFVLGLLLSIIVPMLYVSLTVQT